jgi:antitoxin (DNA-binding transcriptional repressor) of toxin-antitoxin stability system
MRTITMTELNQRISAVTREVIESGEPVQVTNRGRAVLRLVPEPTAVAVTAQERLQQLIDAGLATPARQPHQPLPRKEPVRLSRSIEELLEEDRADRI